MSLVNINRIRIRAKIYIVYDGNAYKYKCIYVGRKVYATHAIYNKKVCDRNISSKCVPSVALKTKRPARRGDPSSLLAFVSLLFARAYAKFWWKIFVRFYTCAYFFIPACLFIYIPNATHIHAHVKILSYIHSTYICIYINSRLLQV